MHMEINLDEIEDLQRQEWEKNEKYLTTFSEWLMEQGLEERTISNHTMNVRTFLQNYLLEYEGEVMEKGMNYIGHYHGDWLIRKCAWSTPETVSKSCTSVKNFYECMLEKGLVEATDYEVMCEEIRLFCMEWMEDCRRQNDPDSFAY